MNIHRLFPLAALALAACASNYPPPDKATLGRINQELRDAGGAQKTATAPAAPMAPQAAPVPSTAEAIPASVVGALLPPLRVLPQGPAAIQPEARFDLVVTDAPLSQVLSGIVADTRFSVVMKPLSDARLAASVPDRVTLRLKNVTLFEVLDTIREVYGYDYNVEGNRIFVQPPEMQTRLYQLNYIVGQRRGVSDMQVTGGASGSTSNSNGGNTGNTGNNTGGTNSNSGYAAVQASALSTVAKADVWGEVEDALRTTLGCVIPASLQAGTASGSNDSRRVDTSFKGETVPGERKRGVDGCSDGRAMTINHMSGTILVRAMPRELQMIERMLKAMQINIERQVIIEAKIIDVELNEGAQQGINWTAFTNNLHRFSVGADTSSIAPRVTSNGDAVGGAVSANSLGEFLGSSSSGSIANGAFSAGLGVALQLRNFSALINFLQTQGTVHVLSSPRIATLNNQKAVLKVGSEEPYVTNINATGDTINNGVTTKGFVTLNYQPFFSGISLDVTPQIDERDAITLHVHTMVNNVVERLKISQPSATAVYVPFATNTISQTDSVVRTRDGQVVVIGGLMTERAQDDRNKVPVVGDVPLAGSLFSKGAQSNSKRELVILLKPTVVKDDSAWTGDIDAVQQRIERMGATLPTGVTR